MSSYYGIVFSEFWRGRTGGVLKKLAGARDTQVLALYLMSCADATMLGLYRLPLGTIAHDTGMSAAAVIRALAALGAESVHFAAYDMRTEHVWVYEMAKIRLSLQTKSPLDPDDKRVKGAQNLYDRLIDNPFLAPFFDRYAKEIRLKRKRSCGHAQVHPQPVAPSRGLQGGRKPVTEAVPGTGTGTSGKSTGAARRVVENIPNGNPDHTPGTFGLYCTIAQEARQLSINRDESDSVSNIAEYFKTLCAQRQIAYDSEIAARAIEAVMTAAARGAA